MSLLVVSTFLFYITIPAAYCSASIFVARGFFDASCISFISIRCQCELLLSTESSSFAPSI